MSDLTDPLTPKDRRLKERPPEEYRLTPEELTAEVEGNRRFIHLVARGWWRTNRHIPYDDVVSAVHLGFVRAAGLFDKRRGFKFATYAKHWADFEVRHLLDRETRRVGPRSRGYRSLGDPALFYASGQSGPPGHGEGEEGGDDHDLNWVPAREERPRLPDDFWDRVRTSLHGRDYRAVEMRFRDGKSYAEIGVDLGVCRERVRQLVDRALEDLRRVPYLGELAAV